MSKLWDWRPPRPNQGIIGHRGVAGIAPENTLAGFRKAAALGINWIEFDIQRCASGEFILMHDKTLSRTTNGQGLVAKIPYEKISTLDAGSWFAPEFSQERVPSLKEALHCLIELNIHPNIEIKSMPSHRKEIAEAFLMELDSLWPSSRPLPLVSSFDIELLIQLRKLHSTLPIGYVIQDRPKLGIQKAFQYRFNTLHCSHKAFHEPALLAQVVQRIPLLIYTVNNFKRIQRLLQGGVTAIFSDLTNIQTFKK